MGEKYKTLGAIGRAIKKEIYDKVHLVASVGIAPNKFLAKMASDMDKPDGLFIIPYGKEKEILAPLPVRRLWGVGKVTEKRLIASGYKTIADIQNAPPGELESLFGSRGGELRALAFGKDDRPIESERKIKSIGDEETYEHDLTDPEEIDRQIAIHSDIVAQRLRKHDLTARTISLKIRFGSFETVMRSMSREDGTNLQEEIYAMCQELLQRIPIREGIRLIGVTGSNLSSGPRMTSLFSHDWEKREKTARAMDEIQKKFGRQALRKGFWLEEEAKKAAAIEAKIKEEEAAKAPEVNPAIEPVKPEITFDDFGKIDLRVAKILTAEKVKKSRKLIKMTVSLGNEERTVVSGIAEHYKPEELIGKQVIFVANLKPAKLMGIESQGMILAASLDGKLVVPTVDMPAGSRVK